MTTSACIPASLPASTDPEPPPLGQDLRDLALQLRFLLGLGTSFAIATVLCAQGAAVRRTGTVLALATSGQTAGFNPAGPLDGAMRKLAAEALFTGQDRLERLEIDAEAAAATTPGYTTRRSLTQPLGTARPAYRSCDPAG